MVRLGRSDEELWGGRYQEFDYRWDSFHRCFELGISRAMKGSPVDFLFQSGVNGALHYSETYWRDLRILILENRHCYPTALLHNHRQTNTR